MLRGIIGPDRVFCAVVKANAYGHGLVEVAKIVAGENAFGGGEQKGWFGVDSVDEAVTLRDAGIAAPMLVLGYIPVADAKRAVRANVRAVVAERATVRALARGAGRRSVPVHIKVETGTQRQGVTLRELPAFARYVERTAGVTLAGVSTHLADIEDTGPHGFARLQLERFARAAAIAEHIAKRPLMRHAAASAAALLMDDARHDLARFGMALYGVWPSARVRVAIVHRSTQEAQGHSFALHPVLTWKTIVGPMHWVPAGSPIGYGCTERVECRTRVAVLPVGYWDGYDRRLSRIAHVLIRGKRCKVLGRVCMNMTIVDVTGVPGVRMEDPAVLIGSQGRAEITADELAEHMGTISYEVVTRINPQIVRLVV